MKATFKILCPLFKTTNYGTRGSIMHTFSSPKRQITMEPEGVRTFINQCCVVVNCSSPRRHLSPWRLESSVSCQYVPDFLRFPSEKQVDECQNVSNFPTFRISGDLAVKKKKEFGVTEWEAQSFISLLPFQKVSSTCMLNCMDGYKTIRKLTDTTSTSQQMDRRKNRAASVSQCTASFISSVLLQ